MKDAFRRATTKDWFAGISCGDGWNASGYGHTKKRTNGRKKIRRQARSKLKSDLRKELLEA